MVAKVWKVVAAQGDHVDDGDTLVILESMKMEIPVLAEAAGTLTSLHVAEGDVVQEGDLIAEIGCAPAAGIRPLNRRSRVTNLYRSPRYHDCAHSTGLPVTSNACRDSS